MDTKTLHPSPSHSHTAKFAKEERAVECQPSKVPLKVLIAGAGIGGLAASIALARRGHKVTVFEQSSELSEIGAGIQVPPNSLRMLLTWELSEFLEGRTIEPHHVFLRRWRNGETIGRTRCVPDFVNKFHAPYYVVHRAHLQKALEQLALRLGVVIKLGSKIESIDAEAGVLWSDGVQHTGDLIVAADGVNSVLRNIVFGGRQEPSQTGFVAYRCTVKTSEMSKDPDTASLLDSLDLNQWIGENGHVMSYPISGGSIFNMVITTYDPTNPKSCDQSNALDEMRIMLQDWDPTLVKLSNLVQFADKWPLLEVPTLMRWVCGRAVILGDAAHAMLPYMSQGAATAVEDAAGLAEAIHLAVKQDEIEPALQVWEGVRKHRARQIQQASALQADVLHLADGPEQEARDASMRDEVEGRLPYSSANRWSDSVTQQWLYAYDCEEEIRRAW